MFETLSKVLGVKELRGKIAATLLLILVFRLGKFIPTPGIDYKALSDFMSEMASGGGAAGTIFSMADMMSGGAMSSGSFFGLGIMPYITASIIFQLLVAIVPALSRIAHEGAAGRKKINQYTRVATVLLCIVQAVMACSLLIGASEQSGTAFVAESARGASFYFYGTISLTVGTVFLMWLGEQIDEFGIGNGISLIIMAGIISRMPRALKDIFANFGQTDGMTPFTVAIILVLFIVMTLAVVMITLGTRRVGVQASKAMRGRKMVAQQKQFLPLRVCQAGVIPIIFAQAIMSVPMFVSSWIDEYFGWHLSSFFGFGAYLYTVLYILLIVFFCYFYTAITFNPTEMADNLKQSGMYMPGIRPGKRTAEHLERIMTRIALAGSVFLAFVAVVPQFVSNVLGVDYTVAGMLGGTGLLIVVGVALDVVQRVESYLLMRNYDGFGVGGGKVRGRR